MDRFCMKILKIAILLTIVCMCILFYKSRNIIRKDCSITRYDNVDYKDIVRSRKFVTRNWIIKDKCRNTTRRYDESKGVSLRNYLVNDPYKFLFCYVPKVACSNLKMVMMALQSRANSTSAYINLPSFTFHQRSVFTRLSELNQSKVNYLLENYRKFMVVRHPLVRVVSAFRNKFEKNTTAAAYFKSKYGKKILRMFRQPGTYSPEGEGVTFPEFVQYLKTTFDQSPALLNEHWAPAAVLCHPCDISFDYIGKYEDLEEDANFILQQLNAPPTMKFPAFMPSDTSSVMHSYLAKLNRSQYDDLLSIYQEDFDLFDYLKF